MNAPQLGRDMASGLTLTSSDLTEGATLPRRHAAVAVGGEDQSPALSWTPYPGAAGYAVTCYDPDAPTGSGVWHWVLADLSVATTSIPRGCNAGRAFVNDLGFGGYSGAAPPTGRKHRYQFRVHALDTARLTIDDDATNAIARFAIVTHTLANDVLTVTFPGS